MLKLMNTELRVKLGTTLAAFTCCGLIVRRPIRNTVKVSEQETYESLPSNTKPACQAPSIFSEIVTVYGSGRITKNLDFASFILFPFSKIDVLAGLKKLNQQAAIIL